MRRFQTVTGGRETARRPRRESDAATGDLVFRYTLVDLAGRQIDVVDRDAPLRPDEVIVAGASETWRIVAVLGTSATVVRAGEGA